MKVVTRRKLDDHEIDVLESYLGKALQEVQPRPRYVTDLRERLTHDDFPKAVKRAQQYRRYMPFIVAGVIGGIVLLLTGTRAILALLSSLGVANGKPVQSPSLASAVKQPVH